LLFTAYVFVQKYKEFEHIIPDHLEKLFRKFEDKYTKPLYRRFY
jgi:hypothetical protein